MKRVTFQAIVTFQADYEESKFDQNKLEAQMLGAPDHLNKSAGIYIQDFDSVTVETVSLRSIEDIPGNVTENEIEEINKEIDEEE